MQNASAWLAGKICAEFPLDFNAVNTVLTTSAMETFVLRLSGRKEAEFQQDACKAGKIWAAIALE